MPRHTHFRLSLLGEKAVSIHDAGQVVFLGQADRLM
jgi:hypothetical protein